MQILSTMHIVKNHTLNKGNETIEKEFHSIFIVNVNSTQNVLNKRRRYLLNSMYDN